MNVLRRDGCPLTVESAETGLVYEEGHDFETRGRREAGDGALRGRV